MRTPAGLRPDAGALANFGHDVSDQTARQCSAAAWDRAVSETESDYGVGGLHRRACGSAGRHGCFTAEVLTWRGPATYYVLFLIQLETRRVTLAGMTQHPTEEWMQQVARNLTHADAGALRGQRYLLHDRDTKFCGDFDQCFALEESNHCGFRRVRRI